MRIPPPKVQVFQTPRSSSFQAIIQRMRGVFHSFQANRQPVSSGTMNALIQIQRQDLLTGLVEVTYPGEMQSILLFNLGAPFALYHRTEDNWRKIPASQWGDAYSQANGEAAVIPLSGDGLRMCLMIFESGEGELEEVMLRPAGFAAHLETVKTREMASLLRVRDEAFHGLIVVPGGSVEVQDVLVFTPGGIHYDIKSLMRLIGTEDRLMRLTQVEFPNLPQFMQEYALRVAFLTLSEIALRRFEQLAGDTLVDLLGQEVNNYAFHQGWKIQFFGCRVVHRQFFQEPAEAIVVYHSLFRVVRQYFQ